jgi:hypothetical protein
MEFAYDGGGLAKGGDVTLFVDGKKAGEGRLEATQPMIFSADETTDVGTDGATPVSDDYGSKDNEFTGQVEWVQIDIDEAAENNDHLITAEPMPPRAGGSRVRSGRAVPSVPRARSRLAASLL